MNVSTEVAPHVATKIEPGATPGWRMERQGLSNTVLWTQGDAVMRWTDGKFYAGTKLWDHEMNQIAAATMKKAVEVGNAWLGEYDE